MYRHVILFHWKHGTTVEQVAAAHRSLATLPDRLAPIRAFSAGPDAGGLEHNADYALIADFDDPAGYLAYRDHPYHLSIIDRFMAPIIESYVRVQYHTDLP